MKKKNANKHNKSHSKYAIKYDEQCFLTSMCLESLAHCKRLFLDGKVSKDVYIKKRNTCISLLKKYREHSQYLKAMMRCANSDYQLDSSRHKRHIIMREEGKKSLEKYGENRKHF